MNHSDLMQFKDEMLKNLRELERKIMTKVNKNQTDFSSDLMTITKSLNSIKENNNSIIDSITEQKLNLDKITTIESELKKFKSTLTSQEKKINDSTMEISYIRERCEKSLSDSLCVPGIIGKNCRFNSFNDYIINNMNEINKLKSEKDFNKKESKELKQKLDQGIKNLSNLVDTFINRSKLYTDGTKKALIDLIDTKVTELDAKNLELLAKLCKIDTEIEQKMKKFGDDLEELNKNKTEQIQNVEDKINNMNNHIEEIDKEIKETKEEIGNFKINEEKFMNEIYEIKNNLNAIFKNENNYESIEKNNTSNNINDSKEINSILNKAKNIKEMQNNNINNNLINYQMSSSNFRSNIKSPEENNNNNIKLETKNFLMSNNMNNPINNNISKSFSKSQINKELSLNEKDPFLFLNQYRNKESPINSEKPLVKFNNNNINNALTSFNSNNNSLNKNRKLSNPEYINTFISSNIKISTDPLKEENIIKRNIDRNSELINNPIISHNKRKFFNLEKNLSINLKKEDINFHLNKKSQKEKNINNINSINIKPKKEKFPMIQEKLVKNIILFNGNIYNVKNNNNNNIMLTKPKNILSHKNKKIKNKSVLNKYSIDKETGVGCKVVKLSFEDDSVTPYNTNGLLTMASNKFLKKKLIKSDESLSFSFDNIFTNMYQYQTNRHFINNKKPRCNKTVQAFFGDDKTNFDKILNSIDSNIKKEMYKTIKL